MISWKFQKQKLQGRKFWWSVELWHGPNHSWHLNWKMLGKAYYLTVYRKEG